VARSRWIKDLRWVRPSRQTRSRKTQEGLLDAAEELFSEKGLDATSVADIAQHAGSSVGAVYHHFRDKNALLFALLERSGEEYRATTREAVEPARWEGASIVDILRGYLEFSLEVARTRPGLGRAILEAVLREPGLREQQRELNGELMARLNELLRARRSEIGHPDPELAIGFVLDQQSSMLKARIDGLTLRPQLADRNDDEFVGEAVRSACAYLQMDPQG
jgi:AcrR family transcriptional regulator